MKPFACSCGQLVYFDSTSCLQCGSTLFFNPDTQTMLSIGANQLLQDFNVKACRNTLDYQACNWVLDQADPQSLCSACRLNQIIPNLTQQRNLLRWRKLESAKKRLLYTLIQLNLPIFSKSESIDLGIAFQFLEDTRSDPINYPDLHVQTGHKQGVITINVLEADDIAIEAARVALNESYRTLLGHFRHESGHYYWMLIQHYFKTDSALFSDWQRLFGDETKPYDESLKTYYQQGPADDWYQNFISPYAGAHPLEDWAETWGHYLHIMDITQTALSYGLLAIPDSFAERIHYWRSLSTILNELNRSAGQKDIYPFVISKPVEEKLLFTHSLAKRLNGMTQL